MNLKILVINILLFVISEVFAYQTRFVSELCPSSDSLTKTFNTILLRNYREVHLGEDDQSAALVHLSWNSSTFKRYDDCRFKVVATIDGDQTRNRGVFVSIQRLNLRKSTYSEDCIDYIRFTFGDQKSAKFCGRLNASVDNVEKTYFGEGGGVIEVRLKLDKFTPLKYIDDTLDVELVFTANEDCGQSNLIKCFNNTCISKSLENDGYHNCPPPSCNDEGGRCPKPPIVVKPTELTANNTDIVISALTSLIFTLVGVGSCLWLCWHIKDCFLPEQDTQGRSSVNGASNGNRRTNNTRSTAFNTPGDNYTSATASTHHTGRQTSPQIDDKDDNPPSYDTLFPHLANSNNENK